MMNRIKNFLLILFACACIISYGQDIQVYPTNWFTGMQWNKVQLIVRSAQPRWVR